MHLRAVYGHCNFLDMPQLIHAVLKVHGRRHRAATTLTISHSCLSGDIAMALPIVMIFDFSSNGPRAIRMHSDWYLISSPHILARHIAMGLRQWHAVKAAKRCL